MWISTVLCVHSWSNHLYMPSGIEICDLDMATTCLKEDVGEVNLKRKYVWVRMKF